MRKRRILRERNELTIRGESSEVARLVERIESVKPGRWRREREIEGRLWRPPGAEPSTYCFSTPACPDLPAVYLLLDRIAPVGLEVSMIMPIEVDRKSLTDDQYNQALDRFYEEYLRPILDGIEAEIQPFRVKLEMILSRDAIEKYESFREGFGGIVLDANDRRRWSRFVTQVHMDGSVLDPSELNWSLRESGLTEEQRRLLVEWYEEGLSMLADYDEVRVG